MKTSRSQQNSYYQRYVRNAPPFTLRALFPNMPTGLAARMKEEISKRGLPMVNAGARVDVQVLLMSGATTGFFVDQRDFSSELICALREAKDIRHLRTRTNSKFFRISFETEGKDFCLYYYVTDIKNMDLILGRRKIAFYYSAIQSGPEMIPEAAFSRLVLGGYLISPFHLGTAEICLEITGLKQLNQRGLKRDLFDIGAFLYKKTKPIGKPRLPAECKGLEPFCYLMGAPREDLLWDLEG